METSLTNFRSQLREALSSFLWRQWSALGVSGHASSTPDPWSIDPEALLLFSTVVARHDARLFDEILDWLQLNAEALNLQRLSRLQKDHGLGEPTVLAAIASQLTKNKAHPKWRPIATRTPAPQIGTEPRPLFSHLPVLGCGDETWLTWGWRRPPVELRGLSQAPQPDRPATFVFKLRNLFGLQTRAEVIAWLLAHETGHPAEIARDTGYFRGSIQSVLNELAASGHVFSLRVGREKRFGIRHDEWRFLLTWSEGIEFPRWLPWDCVLALLQRVHLMLENPRFEGVSSAVQDIELNRAISPALGPLTKAGLWHYAPSGLVGEKSISAHINQLRGLLAHLRIE